MAVPQDALASLLEHASGNTGQDTNQDEAQALLSYLHESYDEFRPIQSQQDDIHPGISQVSDQFRDHQRNNSETHQQRPRNTFRQEESNHQSESGGVLSPRHHHIQIPDYLNAIASNLAPPDSRGGGFGNSLGTAGNVSVAVGLLDNPDVSDVLERAQGFDYGSVGEMGGKRRKAPHERAGWKDMDETGMTSSKRRRKGTIAQVEEAAAAAAAANNNNFQVTSSTGQDLGATGSGHSLASNDYDFLAQARRFQEAGGGEIPGVDSKDTNAALARAFPDQADAGEGSGEGDKRKDSGAVARAEQNRRAQQVYRRRREERMKNLEARSAALEPLQRAYAELQEKVKAFAVLYESKEIENAALKQTLRTLSGTGTRMIDASGGLAVDGNSIQAAITPNSHQLENAFILLATQSRELAKEHISHAMHAHQQ